MTTSNRLIAAALMAALGLGIAYSPGVAQAAGIAGPVSQSGTEVTVMVASLNVRATPSLKAKILGKLTGGTKVQTVAKTSDGAWWQIT